MTTPLLNDIDLARIAPLPDDEKRLALWGLSAGYATVSYRYVRNCFSDIFNISLDLFGPQKATPFARIEEHLVKTCRHEVELNSNLKVARALRHYVDSNNISGRHHEFFPLAIGFGQKVSFWLPMVLAVGGHPHVIFIDPRRNKGLDDLGRRFAFSMMHERIRAGDDDFSSVTLGILRFTEGRSKQKAAKLYTDLGQDLYPFDELERMVSSTYRMWQEIHEEKEAQTRRKGTGTGGLF